MTFYDANLDLYFWGGKIMVTESQNGDLMKISETEIQTLTIESTTV